MRRSHFGVGSLFARELSSVARRKKIASGKTVLFRFGNGQLRSHRALASPPPNCWLGLAPRRGEGVTFANEALSTAHKNWLTGDPRIGRNNIQSLLFSYEYERVRLQTFVGSRPREIVVRKPNDQMCLGTSHWGRAHEAIEEVVWRLLKRKAKPRIRSLAD